MQYSTKLSTQIQRSCFQRRLIAISESFTAWEWLVFAPSISLNSPCGSPHDRFAHSWTWWTRGSCRCRSWPGCTLRNTLTAMCWSNPWYMSMPCVCLVAISMVMWLCYPAEFPQHIVVMEADACEFLALFAVKPWKHRHRSVIEFGSLVARLRRLYSNQNWKHNKLK